MSTLIIAEKPSVARDIARVLGVTKKGEGFLYNNDTIVSWAIGHLVSLCEPGEVNEEWKKWNMAQLPMLPETVPLKCLPATTAQYNTLKKLLHSPKVEKVICATDAAREGELIFRNIYQFSGCNKPVQRLWISSMTDEAIRAGFAALRPGSDYDALYESARSRSIADWLVGMNASRAFSLRYNARLSIGRVQTPTLCLIVKRDAEIENFVPQDYWELHVKFQPLSQSEALYEGVWFDPKTKESRIDKKEEAERLRKLVSGKEGCIKEAKKSRKKEAPPLLYDLTTLQREANRRFGFSADKTLQLAQTLYEKHKLITYPRTDSRHLPDDMAPKVKKLMQKLPEPYATLVASSNFNPEMHSKRFYDNSKISDHHAIVPTEKKPNLDSLGADEKAVYDLVARSLIAAHYPDYEYDSTNIVTSAEAELFKSTGTVVINPGWKAVLPTRKKAETENPPLPELNKGDKVKAASTSVKACKTRPPERMTDASLLGMMENAGKTVEDETLREELKASGIGTPATRAAIIERLISVGYVRRSGKNLLSTQKGRQLIRVVPEQIASAATTGKWEKALHALADYKDEALRAQKATRFRSGIDRFARFLVEAAKNAPGDVVFEKENYAEIAKAKKNTRRKAPRTPKQGG